MDHELLVRTALTSEEIAAGERLVRRLDQEDIPVAAAFWMFVDEANLWRLVIASPDYGGYGPRGLTDRIGDLIDEMGETHPGFMRLIVVEPRDLLVQTYGYQVRSRKDPPPPEGKDLLRRLDNGDAFLYRFLWRTL